jgi:hypothetical protein
MCDAELDVPTELDDPKGERAAAAAARAAATAEAEQAAADAKTPDETSGALPKVRPVVPKATGDEPGTLEEEVAGLIAEEAEKVAADNQARYEAEAKSAAATPKDSGTPAMEAATAPGTHQVEAMEVDEALRGRPRAPSEEEASPPSTKRLCAGNPEAFQTTHETGASSSSAGGASTKAEAPRPAQPEPAGTTPSTAAAKVVAKASSRAKAKN